MVDGIERWSQSVGRPHYYNSKHLLKHSVTNNPFLYKKNISDAIQNFSMFNQTGNKVWDLVQDWNPEEEYGHERKFQSELRDYLDKQLNDSSSLMDSTDYRVSTERGTSKGDVVVNDTVGIELKRDFTNSQKRKLRGQLEDYADNYDFVIACACGIQDTDGWYEVKEKMLSSRQIGDQTNFKFEIKESDKFGNSKESGGFW